jgi:hypothetical protein
MLGCYKDASFALSNFTVATLRKNEGRSPTYWLEFAAAEPMAAS